MIKKIYPQLLNFFQKNLKISSKVQVHPTASILSNSNSQIELGEGVQIGKHSTLIACVESKIVVNKHSTIGTFNYINAGPGDVIIEEDVLMAHFVCIIASSHGIDDLNIPIRCQTPDLNHKIGVTIGSGSWLGAQAIILPGVTIGRGAVVGAGAVVTQEVPDFGIVAGNPAKLIRYRGKKESVRSKLDA